MTRLISIAAVAENGVIGDDQSLPWYYPVDLKHYKQTIDGHPIILGRKTYETTDGGFQSCTPKIVLTSQNLDTPDGVVTVDNISEAISTAEQTAADTVYVLGGETIYRQLMPHVDRLVLTHIPGEYDGDTYFPDWDNNDWDVLERYNISDELEVVEYDP